MQSVRLLRTRSSLLGGSDENGVMMEVRDLASKRSHYVQEQVTLATVASMGSLDEVFNNEPVRERSASVASVMTEEQQIQALEDAMYDQMVADSPTTETANDDFSDQKIHALLDSYEDLLSKLCADKKLSGVQEIVANRVILSVAQQTSNASLKVLLVSQVLQPDMKEKVWLNMIKAQARKDGQPLSDDKLAALKPLTDAANIISQNALTLARALIQYDTPESFDVNAVKRKETKIAQYAVEAYLELPEVESLARKLDDVLRGGAQDEHDSAAKTNPTSTWMEKLTNVSFYYLKSFVAFNISGLVPLFSVYGMYEEGVKVVDLPLFLLKTYKGVDYFKLLIVSLVFTGLRYAVTRVYTDAQKSPYVQSFISKVVAILTPLVKLGGNFLLFFASSFIYTSLVGGGQLTASSASAVLKAFWIGVKASGALFVGAVKAMLTVAMMNLRVTGAVVAGSGVVYVVYQALMKLCTMWYERPLKAAVEGTNTLGTSSSGGMDVTDWIVEYFKTLIMIPFALTNKTVRWAGNLAMDYVIRPLLNKLSAWFTSESSFLDPLLAKLNIKVDAAKLGVFLTLIISGMTVGVSATGTLSAQWSNFVSMFTNLLSSVGLSAGSNSTVIVFAGGGLALSHEMWATQWFADILGARQVQGGARLRVQRPIARITAGYCDAEEDEFIRGGGQSGELVAFGIRRIGIFPSTYF